MASGALDHSIPMFRISMVPACLSRILNQNPYVYVSTQETGRLSYAHLSYRLTDVHQSGYSEFQSYISLSKDFLLIPKVNVIESKYY